MSPPVFRPEPRSLKLLRLALSACALAVFIQAACGFAGVLRAAPWVIGLAAVAGAVAFVVRGVELDAAEARRWTFADGAGATALALALASRLWDGLHRETFTYDVLSYHLHLPASWHALGRLTLIPTPFGDQAPAYAPANAELLYELAIAATGNLRLAHAGQLPFAGLAALAIYATARGLGSPRAMGFGAALAFLLIPEVWQQATGAMTDLALASFVLSALPFLNALGLRGRRRDVVALGCAVGLALGTKYVGALMLVPIAGAVLLAARRSESGGDQRRGAVATASILVVLTVAGGGFWYVRNGLTTGDPTFPVTLQLGPWTLARGLYGGQAMRAWSYHWPVSDIHPLLEIFTETTFGFLASGVAATLLGLRARTLRWVLLSVGFVALGWLVVPYQQSRFFFSAWGTLAIGMVAASLHLSPRQRGLLLIPAIAGAALQAPTTARLLVALVATIAAVASCVQGDTPEALARFRNGGLHERLRALLRRPAGRLACAALLLGGGGGTLAWARGHGGLAPYAVGDDHDDAWSFLARQRPGLRVAYAGSNLPLPLWGPTLGNFVQYVNISRGLAARLQDFLPEAATLPVSAEPAPERARPDQGAWLANLESARIDTLFVAALYPDVRASMTHDGDGFPIERTWADALPERFALLFANPGVRVYRLRPPGREERTPR